MSKFKAEFTLKQHTPIIHFQSGQSGATLRATELKPKFDKFLKKYAFDGEIPKGFLIDKDRDALNYKVKIFNLSTSQELKYQTFIAKKERDNTLLREGSYFGDNNSLKIDKIKVEFFSYNLELLEKIKNYFDEFISVNSFGTRNNKGFGNFTNEKTNKNHFEKYLKSHFIIVKSLNNREPLKKVLSLYQKIKSGGRADSKSELMKYFFKDSIRWEKRWIKRRLKELKQDWFNDLKDEYHENNDFNFLENEEYIFARALLGLAENNEFLVKSNNRDKLIVKIKNQEIERFPSPINIKIFDNNIYILLDLKEPINSDIFSKTFTFTAYYKNHKNNTCDLGTLTTPSNFNIEEFLNKASI